MSTLLSAYPGDSLIEYFVVVVAAVAVVSALGWSASLPLRRNAAVGHWILLIALACCLAAPFAAAGFLAADASVVHLPLALFQSSDLHSPGADVQQQPPSRGAAADDPQKRAASQESRRPARTSESSAIAYAFSGSINDAAAAPSRTDVTKAVASGALLAWLVGVVCLLIGLLRSLARGRALRRSCRPLHDSRVVDAMHAARQRLSTGLRPDVVETDELAMPAVVGIVHPVIALPAHMIHKISPEALCDVLVHETAHILRCDSLVLLLQRIARTAYWPITTVHLLNRELSRARECACDNYVLGYRNAVTYGEELLLLAQLAKSNITRAAWSVELLGWRGRFEDRVTQIVEPRRTVMTKVHPAIAVVCLGCFTVATVLLCGMRIATAQVDALNDETASATSEADAAEDEDDKELQAPDPIIADNYFLAPVTSELQKLKVVTRSSGYPIKEDDNITAYLSVDAASLLGADNGLANPTGESLAPIRQSLRKLAKSAPQGKLRGVVDFGNLPPENYDVSDMIVEVFQGMAIKSGFADAKVYGCWYRKPHDWELPEKSFVEMPEYETVVPVGEARIYPVATTLSRYLTDADLYIEIIFQNADADRLISDEQLPELRAAIDRLNLASKQYARVSAYYGKDIAPDGGTELAIAKHQDADFYQSLIDVLKDAGFENVALCISAGGSAICNDY